MVFDYLKIYNFGNKYLIHVNEGNNVVVKKAYVYKNSYNVTNNDINFGKYYSNLLLFDFLMRLIVKKSRLSFILSVFTRRKIDD